MDDFAFPQEADDIVHIRVVGETENVVVGEAGLLLCRQVLGQIGDDIAGDLHSGRRPGIAGGKLRIDTGGMIHKIGIKAGGSDLILVQVTGELVNQSAHHLQVPQFLSTCKGVKREQQKSRI